MVQNLIREKWKKGRINEVNVCMEAGVRTYGRDSGLPISILSLSPLQGILRCSGVVLDISFIMIMTSRLELLHYHTITILS